MPATPSSDNSQTHWDWELRQVELAKQVDQTRQVNQTKQDEQIKQVEDLSESPLMLSDFMQPVGQLLSWGGKLMAGRKLSG